MQSKIKNKMPEINNKIVGHTNEFMFALYLFGVWLIYIFVYYADLINANLFTALFMLGAFVIIVIFSTWLLKQIRKSSISSNSEPCKKKKLISMCFFSAASFFTLFVWYLAYFPGAYSLDSMGQYVQALSGQYNDWHPVWHTFLVFTIPLKLTGDVSAVVLCQIIYFSIVLGYMAMTLYELGNIKCSVFSLGYVLLNPYTGCIAMYPWKDVTFGVTALLVMICVVKIYATKGKWQTQKGRILFLAIALASATLFRHNAILFTGIMVIALFWHMKKKEWMKLVIYCLLLLVIVKGPVYSVLQVEEPDKRRLEMMGLPLTVIANVTKENPEKLDKQTAQFVYSMATQEEWVEYYRCGDFNSIKWKINTTIVDETSTVDILKMMIHCIKVSPKASLQALFSLTDIVYAIDGEIEGDVFPAISVNELGISYAGNENISRVLLKYKELILNSILKYLFYYIGTTNITMLAFVLAKNNLNKRSDLKKMGLCVPIFTYNFGTMLLLTGADSRFFYVSFLICPLVVFLMLRQSKPMDEILIGNEG